MSGKMLSVLVLAGAAAFGQVQADASRGPEILREKGCTGCHAVGSSGSTVSASSLSRPLNREYTPAGFTATLWNHAPRMFAAIRKEKGSLPQLSDAEAADLFAYFASLRYFEPMGEAARGARLIHSRKCAECHLSSGPGGLIEHWRTISDPIDLAAKMWNHQPRMSEEMNKRGIRPPSLTAQDLTDLVVYVRGLPGGRKSAPVMMQLPSLDTVDKLLDQYGCTGCHKGELAFDRIIGDTSMTDIAASMWNHGTQMKAAQREIPSEEMRKIVSWVWTRQLVRPRGNAARGQRFANRHKCVECHSGGGPGPAFAKLEHPYTVVDMTSAVWKHGSGMQSAMEQKGIKWPRFSPQNIEDLLAFISSARGSTSAANRE
jgi:cytochrome c551/c552